LFLFACAEQLFEGTVSRDGGWDEALEY
jgi:hypothetical protein